MYRPTPSQELRMVLEGNVWDALERAVFLSPLGHFPSCFTGHTHTRFLTSLSLGLLTHPTGMVSSGVCEDVVSHYIVYKSVSQKPRLLSTRESLLLQG